MEGLSVENAARDGKRLFQGLHPFVAFETIQNNAQVCANTAGAAKVYMRRKWNI
jgi:hypothetical protein